VPDIEISIDVDITAGIAFWVDPEHWLELDEAGKRAHIAGVIDAIAGDMANDVIRFRAGNLSASITGPIQDTISLDEVQIYDPRET
jgi:hypothetical protein